MAFFYRNYLFIEFETSTSAYNLITVVVEDSRTFDWYPFEQNITFQGDGGGWHTTQQFGWELKEAQKLGVKLRLSIRIAHNSDLKDLINGKVTWAKLKERSVPALISADPHFQFLRDRFIKELSGKPGNET